VFNAYDILRTSTSTWRRCRPVRPTCPVFFAVAGKAYSYEEPETSSDSEEDVLRRLQLPEPLPGTSSTTDPSVYHQPSTLAITRKAPCDFLLSSLLLVRCPRGLESRARFGRFHNPYDGLLPADESYRIGVGNPHGMVRLPVAYRGFCEYTE
jgi:hypothetical protein